MHGLTFIALANSSVSQRRWREEERHRKERAERLHKLYFGAKDELTSEQQLVLNQLQEKLQADEVEESPKQCPECHRSMRQLTLDEIEIDACRWCRSIWFDPGELQLLSGEAQDIPSSNLTSRSSRFQCPVCGETMIEYVFKHPATLLVDACARQHGVYLEDRELERVFKIETSR